jgi:hypothetical protein
MSALKQRLTDDMKMAMKAKEKDRLMTIRSIQAAIKQREVDERIELDDAAILAILDKLAKQRRESISQYQEAGRDDLVTQEQVELEIIQGYLPEQLSEEELKRLVKDAIAECDAHSMQDMGKVMAIIKPKAQGRADMGQLSKLVKDALA